MDESADDGSLRDEIVELREVIESCANNIFILMNENRELRNDVSELKGLLMLRTGAPPPVVAKTPASVLPWTIVDKKKKKPSKSLIINPTSEQNVAETRKVLKKIDPSEFNVKSVKQTQKGGVIIECESSAERQQLMLKTANVFSSGYSVTIPVKKMPRVRLYGITEKYDENELVGILKKQNSDLFPENCSVKLEYMSFVEAKSVYCAKLEVDAVTFAKLMANKKVFIGWDSCWVNEDLNIRRCFKCWGFNHVASKCPESSNKCPKCCGDHHQNVCTSSVLKCAVCCEAVRVRHMTIDTNHSALSDCCPSLLARIEAQRRQINYDQ